VPLWIKVGSAAVLLAVGALAAVNHFRPVSPPAGFVDGRPLVLEFWAEWCGPCKAYGPVLEKVTGEFGDRITLVKVNVDEDGATAKQYDVNGIPLTLIFDAKGKLSKKLLGGVDAATLKEAIDSAF
jgi:thioredoxin 1